MCCCMVCFISKIGLGIVVVWLFSLHGCLLYRYIASYAEPLRLQLPGNGSRSTSKVLSYLNSENVLANCSTFCSG